jgi:hypothetical protein
MFGDRCEPTGEKISVRTFASGARWVTDKALKWARLGQ